MLLLKTIIKGDEIDVISLIKQSMTGVGAAATMNRAGVGRRKIDKV